MSRWMIVILATGVVMTLLAIGHVDPVLASTSQIGKHVGDEVKSWATYLLLGVAALVAIPLLARRDIGGGITLVILVILVGGFAFAPNVVKGAIESLWRTFVG